MPLFEKRASSFSLLLAYPFLPFLPAANSLIFELDNLLTERYTGIFSTSLTLTIYSSTPDFPPPARADLILPITTKAENQSQMLVYPSAEGANASVRVPENTAEAWLEVIATGAAEEVRFACDFSPSSLLS